MQHRNTKMIAWSNEIIWHLLIPTLFMLSLIFFFPFRNGIVNSDEGIQVIKSLLVNEGYQLYEEIWSDQPPLFTMMLALVFRATEYSLTLGRLCTIFLSVALMWALVQLLRFTWGKLHAVIGAIILFLLPYYNKLSTAVMIGLPSISFVMISTLFLILWHQRSQKRWLVLSGSLLGFSILTKLFTAFIAPIFIIGLLAGSFRHLKDEHSWRNFMKPALIWGISFTIVIFISILTVIKPDNLMQLVFPHITAREIEIFQMESLTISFHIWAVRDIMLLAAIGIVVAILKKSWLTMYPVMWMITAYILLSQYSPVWVHHQVLVTIPAAILAAVAAGDSIDYIVHWACKRNWNWAAGPFKIFTVLLFLSVFITRFPTAVQMFDLRPEIGMVATSAEASVLTKMNAYAKNTNWIVTDMPIFAFWLQKPVPPNLAVFSSKRIETGNLSEKDVINAIIYYEPEQVFLGRFELPSVRNYLNDNYYLVHERHLYALFLHQDLMQSE